MPPKLKGPVHFRVGPHIDVAACGARSEKGVLRFSLVAKLVNCPGCREKRVSTNPDARDAFGRRQSLASKAVSAMRAENLLDRRAFSR